MNEEKSSEWRPGSLKIKGVFYFLFIYHQVFFILVIIFYLCFLCPVILLAIRFNLIVLLGFFVCWSLGLLLLYLA